MNTVYLHSYYDFIQTSPGAACTQLVQWTRRKPGRAVCTVGLHLCSCSLQHNLLPLLHRSLFWVTLGTLALRNFCCNNKLTIAEESIILKYCRSFKKRSNHLWYLSLSHETTGRHWPKLWPRPRTEGPVLGWSIHMVGELMLVFGENLTSLCRLPDYPFNTANLSSQDPKECKGNCGGFYNLTSELTHYDYLCPFLWVTLIPSGRKVYKETDTRR